MSSLDKDTRATYWRSLEAFEAALDSDPALRELVENEFPSQAQELFDPPSRRRFLQLMGASIAFAGVAGAGCKRWEQEEIVPLSQRPEGYVPGVPRHFATAVELGGVADGVVVTSYDGRPIKVEGNAQHPFGTGATSSFTQASILHLYDPDRSHGVRRQDGPGNWDDFESFIRGKVVGSTGAGLRILSEATSSPTIEALRESLLATYPQARWHEYEPLSLDNEREGIKLAMGQALRPIARLDRARRIVALDADLFSTHPARLRYARDFAKGRGAAQDMNRLYAVESTFTSAGVAADHRLPLPSSHMPALLDALAMGIESGARLRNAGMDGQAAFGQVLQSLTKGQSEGGFAVLTEGALRFVAAMAQDLLERDNRYRSVIVVGHAQPPEVHARVALLNATLGANGRTLEYHQLPDADRPSHMESIKALAADMQAGQVETLVILGGNPVYSAPADVDFAAALSKVATSVHLSEYFDETSAACSWHLPRANYLESWGDARTYDGTVTVVQPLIEPMWLDAKNRGSKTPIELLALILGRGHVSGEDLVRKTFGERIRPGLFSTTVWRKALHDGFVEGTAYAVVSPPAPRPVPAQAAANLGRDNLEVVFMPSSHSFDGRFANNAWLQETPDFITKLTWDNAALVNPNTAHDLGIKNGDLIDLEAGGRRIQVAAYTLPGQARGSIALAVGHGRTRAGRVGGMPAEGVNPTGFDAYKLRTSAAPYVVTGAAARATGGTYALASTQDHWNFSDATGRMGVAERTPSLVRDVPIDTYRKDPSSVAKLEHAVPIPGFAPPQNGESLWEEHDYSGPRPGSHSEAPRHKWGMSIDLDKCTGCNACMLACQSENNVPVVGKEQVAKSREMHWIRIDRYFTGDDLRDNPRIAHQPLTCQQCENAPCEQVCPVGATIHTEEGLNDMVYNRCVGTRYCLNNCPYRVRRFNFLDYLNRSEAPGGPIDEARNKVRQLLFNPEVTVRSRGVMEKCTFCVQRIQSKKIVAKNERRELRDGEIQTACMQACPTNAILFGDLNDDKSMVKKAHDEPRAYSLLTGLNTKPRNLFLARLRNPHPQLG